jgi:hypothetical protein
MTNTLLQTKGHSTDEIVRVLSNGKRITIGKTDVDFFSQLQQLSDETKIELFNISSTAMELALKDKKEAILYKLKCFAKAKWLWRETGEDANLLDPYTCRHLFDYDEVLNIEDIIKLFKKGKFSPDAVQTIINVFESDTAVIYKK